jgi:biopolymer transport protein ExbB/TolQ
MSMEQAIVRTTHDLSRGVWVLELTAGSAPLLGFLGTCYGMLSSFRGCIGEKSQCLAALVLEITGSILYLAAGLALGILARWAQLYCVSRIDNFALEMRSGALELSSDLALRKQ